MLVFIQKRIPANTDLAQFFPYSRAVRIGDIIEICGTGAYDINGNLVGDNDVYLQAKFIYQIIEETLLMVGARLTDVVKVTIFVTDIKRWEELAQAHREYFEQDIAPAVTVVEVNTLISEEMLVEIEATAVLQPQTS